MSARTWGHGLGLGSRHSRAESAWSKPILQPVTAPPRSCPHASPCVFPQVPPGTLGSTKHPALRRGTDPPLHLPPRRDRPRHGLAPHRQEPPHRRSRGAASRPPAAAAPLPRAGGGGARAYPPGLLLVLRTQRGTCGLRSAFGPPQRRAAARPGSNGCRAAPRTAPRRPGQHPRNAPGGGAGRLAASPTLPIPFPSPPGSLRAGEERTAGPAPAPASPSPAALTPVSRGSPRGRQGGGAGGGGAAAGPG